MTGLARTTPGDDRSDPSSTPDTRSELSAVVETAENGRRSCTIHPTDATGVDLMSQWITADDDSFVEIGAVE
ncbi:DUF7511 domain-containing protein [Halococcus hamelinensis]|uniref:DUF7511 domain-containing protein n=1 Tax=Halococcus hamelinensis 100A6 TaxID=1132509 RepID=M0MCI9_9EURY|nr:hypothetical protein C447_00930 [Halococcus hamelinensis 100A6]